MKDTPFPLTAEEILDTAKRDAVRISKYIC